MVFAKIKSSGGQGTEAKLPGSPVEASKSNPLVDKLERETASLHKFFRVVEAYAHNQRSLLNEHDVAGVHRNADELKQIQFKVEKDFQARNGALSPESIALLRRPQEMVYEYIERFNTLHSATRPESVPGQRLLLLNALASRIKESMPQQCEDIYREINRSMGGRFDS